MNQHRKWTRDELIIAFSLYCRTPFGKLHKTNPRITEAARLLDRTPSALAMKLVNFASLDPIHKSRDVKGLSNISHADKAVWEEFNSDWESLSFQSEKALEHLLPLVKRTDSLNPMPKNLNATTTEKTAIVRVRLVQRFFREAVLASYESKCALCGLNLPELLIASHIIPWSKSIKRRADPTNGIAFCSIHDSAFDRGLFSLDKSFRVILSLRSKQDSDSRLQVIAFKDAEGQLLGLPRRFPPDQSALKFHREQILQKH